MMSEALRRHWPEYLMEAGGLGLFMVSACLQIAIITSDMEKAYARLRKHRVRHRA